ncbi:YchJ family protein [Streptomyces smyrnaeus]|uniref:YchJ family protein n=1 Tax=Streptomyces TaxID=1883 RepID=UPI00160E56CF|nr:MULTISPECIES: YchJ family metal-binding protein [unclassified Streptomyces]MBQ0862659.1 hypothetical protein [Streptomyces sp. RK75]MBQ1119332.1 hypothetical protein [Streptomyces sp. B15]MBQ1160331.1 hypothetical protein [Streptomyces sp. A73]
MPRRKPAGAAPRRATPATSLTDCPCGAGRYAQCCGRAHRGEAAPATPEELMRSRYSAFVLGDTAYLLRTWHPETRPATLDLTGGPRWTGLEILDTTGGSAFHREGTVTFRAHHLGTGGEPGTQEERSRFVRVDGVWMYVDGTVA